MLNPSMKKLTSHVENRYLLVNFAAQIARDIASCTERNGETLDDKPVKIALDKIAEGKVNIVAKKKTPPNYAAYDIEESIFYGFDIDDDNDGQE